MACVKLLVLCACVSFAFSQMTGGWTDIDVNDKQVKELSVAALQEVDARSNSIKRHRVVKLEQAQAQVVAGINYRLTLTIDETECDNESPLPIEQCAFTGNDVQHCTITFWMQPWLKSQQITEYKCEAKAESTTPTVTRSGLLGGGEEADPDSEDALNAGQFAVQRMNMESNSLYLMVLMDVKKVYKQTVAGTKWQLVLEVGMSSCQKNRMNGLTQSPKDCPVKPSQTSKCSVDVLEQKWSTPKYQLLTHKCVATTTQLPPNVKTTVTRMDQGHSNNKVLGGDNHDFVSYGAFEEFQANYNRTYKDRAEEKKRFLIFQNNMKIAYKLQSKEKGDATYGPTKFADMSEDEFRTDYLTPRWDVSLADSMDQAIIPDSGDVPDAWDWRDHKAVTEVKNQGSCGSCWAFSTTGNIEGQWALKKGQLLSLSEQELVDCDSLDQGCNGGLPSNAYKSIEKLGGLETEKEYPYEGKNDKCEFNKQEADVYINNSLSISTDEDDMKTWLYHNGPISIGINAMAMQFYMGGVSHPWSFFCSPDDLDHGVLIVGYGVKAGWFGNNPYWIVKNSWGPDWGENGYYLVYRGSGVCGLNKMPTSAVVE